MQCVTNPGTGFGSVTKWGSSLRERTDPRRPRGFGTNSMVEAGRKVDHSWVGAAVSPPFVAI